MSCYSWDCSSSGKERLSNCWNCRGAVKDFKTPDRKERGSVSNWIGRDLEPGSPTVFVDSLREPSSPLQSIRSLILSVRVELLLESLLLTWISERGDRTVESLIGLDGADSSR